MLGVAVTFVCDVVEGEAFVALLYIISCFSVYICGFNEYTLDLYSVFQYLVYMFCCSECDFECVSVCVLCWYREYVFRLYVFVFSVDVSEKFLGCVLCDV